MVVSVPAFGHSADVACNAARNYSAAKGKMRMEHIIANLISAVSLFVLGVVIGIWKGYERGKSEQYHYHIQTLEKLYINGPVEWNVAAHGNNRAAQQATSPAGN
jgi:vancomycin permeability regulator SanA